MRCLGLLHFHFSKKKGNARHVFVYIPAWTLGAINVLSSLVPLRGKIANNNIYYWYTSIPFPPACSTWAGCVASIYAVPYPCSWTCGVCRSWAGAAARAWLPPAAAAAPIFSAGLFDASQLMAQLQAPSRISSRTHVVWLLDRQDHRSIQHTVSSCMLPMSNRIASRPVCLVVHGQIKSHPPVANAHAALRCVDPVNLTMPAGCRARTPSWGLVYFQNFYK